MWTLPKSEGFGSFSVYQQTSCVVRAHSFLIRMVVDVAANGFLHCVTVNFDEYWLIDQAPSGVLLLTWDDGTTTYQAKSASDCRHRQDCECEQ